MDAFYAAVEQRDNPALRGKPLLVGGTSGRGVVTTASYQARVFGCKSAMPMAQALRLCPHAVVVKPRIDVYSQESRKLRLIFERFSPELEPVSIDEAYLDCTSSWRAALSALGSPAPAHTEPDNLLDVGLKLGAALKHAVLAETQLVASVGVADNKFLAKLASDIDKPDGLRAISSAQAPTLLAPMDVGVIRGIGDAARAKLAKLGVRTVADLRAVDPPTLTRAFGRHALDWLTMANGQDARRITPGREAKSIGCSKTFNQDLTTKDQARAALLDQAQRIARELREANLWARQLTVAFRRPDFATYTRSITLPQPTHATEPIWLAVRAILDAWWAGTSGPGSGPGPLRLTGVTATDLSDGTIGTQLDLFGQLSTPNDGRSITKPATDQTSQTRQARLDAATDAIVKKFGKNAVRRG